jgi:diaminobutyrate-2-oxoglutarate transaminase
LIIETAGARSEVLKLLPPLTIEEEELRDGITRIGESLEVALERMQLSHAAVASASGV